MTGLAIMALLAYLLGSVSGSLLFGRLRHVDIRRLGSGNAGGTNAFRTQGLAFALVVVLIDIGKGTVAASLPRWLPIAAAGNAAGNAGGVDPVLVCALAAVAGHCYPVWHGFRGGKGAGTAVGALLLVQPWVMVPMLAVWLVTLTATGFVGLATMLAAAALMPALWWLESAPGTMVFGLVLVLFIVFTHRSNIRNMIDGTEYRFEGARLSHWLGRKP